MTSVPAVPHVMCLPVILSSPGGLDDTLHTIIDYACIQNIPFVFALNRKALGRSVNKAVPVSVVGIFSYAGAQVSGQGLPPTGTACGQTRERGLGRSQCPAEPPAQHGRKCDSELSSWLSAVTEVPQVPALLSERHPRRWHPTSLGWAPGWLSRDPYPL